MNNQSTILHFITNNGAVSSLFENKRAGPEKLRIFT